MIHRLLHSQDTAQLDSLLHVLLHFYSVQSDVCQLPYAT